MFNQRKLYTHDLKETLNVINKPQKTFWNCRAKKIKYCLNVILYTKINLVLARNYISAISWPSVLLVEETGVPREKLWPAANNWQTLSHNFVFNWTINCTQCRVKSRGRVMVFQQYFSHIIQNARGRLHKYNMHILNNNNQICDN